MKKYLVILTLLAGMACADTSWIQVDQYEPEHHLKGVQDDLYAGVPYRMAFMPDSRNEPAVAITVTWDDVPAGTVIDGNEIILRLPDKGVYYIKATITHVHPDPNVIVPVEKACIAVNARYILYLESVFKWFGFYLPNGGE